MKTQTAVEQDFYNALKNTTLGGIVSGQIYKSRLRPLNSKSEDIIIIATALTASQLQLGVVRILIYTQGISRNSTMLPNIERISEIENAAILLPDELKIILSRYDGITLQDAISYEKDEETEEYFVSVKINFNYLT